MNKYLYETQEKFKLTKEMVEKAEPESIIHSGIAYREHPWFNQAKSVEDGGCLEEDGRSAKMGYVIYRGFVSDWCIYHTFDANLQSADYLDDPNAKNTSPERIANHGGKLHRDMDILAVVDCNEETLELYRH